MERRLSEWQTRQQWRTRRGSTLVEQMVLLAILGMLAAIGVRGIATVLNATMVHVAARDIADLLALAREQASATGTRTAVRFDPAAGRVVVHAGRDTIARYDVAQHGALALEASRDSMAYAPSGLGYGAANLRVVLRRGASAETLTVSRLGRVRR
jgi:Tfp pilus assembly protein FimT